MYSIAWNPCPLSTMKKRIYLADSNLRRQATLHEKVSPSSDALLHNIVTNVESCRRCYLQGMCERLFFNSAACKIHTEIEILHFRMVFISLKDLEESGTQPLGPMSLFHGKCYRLIHCGQKFDLLPENSYQCYKAIQRRSRQLQ